MTKPGTVIVGIRFRPSAGGQVLQTPLSEIANQRVPLADLLPPAAAAAAAGAGPGRGSRTGARHHRRAGRRGAPDPAMARAAVLLRDPAARTEAVAAEVGLSERQFRRRSQAAAGYGPKTLQRVLRFQRFVRLLDAAPGPRPHPSTPPTWHQAARPRRPGGPGRLRRPGPPHPRMLRPVRLHPRQPWPASARAPRLSTGTSAAEKHKQRRARGGQSPGGSAIMAVPTSRKPSRA